MATTTHEPTEVEDDDTDGAIAFLDCLTDSLLTLHETTSGDDLAVINAIRLVLGYVATERVRMLEDRCPSCGQRHGDDEDDEPETSSGKTVQ